MDFQKGDEVTVKGTVDYVGPDHVTVIVRGVNGSVHQLHAHASQVQKSGGVQYARQELQDVATKADRDARGIQGAQSRQTQPPQQKQ